MQHRTQRNTAALAALVAALALAGCASQGPAHTPLAQLAPADIGLTDAPPARAADATALNTPQWWTGLGDAQLNQLINQALTGNPSLTASNARFEKAAALATAAARPAMYEASSAPMPRASATRPTV